MADIVGTAIKFTLSNFTLTFLVIGFVFSLIAIGRARKPAGGPLIVNKLFFWFLFFSIGISNLYNFAFHVFFGETAARFIGWEDSPFQLEVGMASLGFSVVGFLAAWRGFDLRLAAVIGYGIFTLGAAAGHVHEMAVTHNFAAGNAGVIFYTDLLIPLLGLLLLWLQHRYGAPRKTAR